MLSIARVDVCAHVRDTTVATDDDLSNDRTTMPAARLRTEAQLEQACGVHANSTHGSFPIELMSNLARF